jgi:formate/nitrite transporter FocA (FNT family)
VITIILVITVFAVSGYQHVVANMYLTSIAAFMNCMSHTMTTDIAVKIFGNCILISALGNAIGGALLVGLLAIAGSKK